MGLKELLARLWDKIQDEKATGGPGPEQQPESETVPEEEAGWRERFLAGEIDRMEKIAAILGERMNIYLREEFMQLPVLTRAMLMYRIPEECRPEPIVCPEVTYPISHSVDTPEGPVTEVRHEPVEIDYSVASRIFQFLGDDPEHAHSWELAKGPDETYQALIALYGKDHEEAWRLYKEHEERIAAVKKEGEAAQKAAFERYAEYHFQALTEEQRPLAAYAFARQFPPQGRSGAHFMGPLSELPFQTYSWAATEPVDGVAFSIDRACFAARDPLLFYAYDCDWDIVPGMPLEKAGALEDRPWLSEVYASIEGCSSGIRLEGHQGPVILFRLDRRNIRKLDILYGRPDDAEQPDYIFTWPGAGEFSCTLGEVVDGKLVILHRDDFVMK